MRREGWSLSCRPGTRAFSNPSLVALEAKSLRISDEIYSSNMFESNELNNNSHPEQTQPIFEPKMEIPSLLHDGDRFINPQSIKKEANTEVYGFVGWVASFFGFGLYLMWAYLPDHILHELGVSYYPDKYVT